MNISGQIEYKEKFLYIKGNNKAKRTKQSEQSKAVPQKIKSPRFNTAFSI